MSLGDWIWGRVYVWMDCCDGEMVGLEDGWFVYSTP